MLFVAPDSPILHVSRFSFRQCCLCFRQGFGPHPELGSMKPARLRNIACRGLYPPIETTSVGIINLHHRSITSRGILLCLLERRYMPIILNLTRGTS
jgi:hypothetical protein